MLSALAPCDVGLRCPLRHVEFELHQELHDLLLQAGQPAATQRRTSFSRNSARISHSYPRLLLSSRSATEARRSRSNIPIPDADVLLWPAAGGHAPGGPGRPA